MGIGMQIAYFGFAGSAQLEAEASIQLIRLERFSARLAGGHGPWSKRGARSCSRAPVLVSRALAGEPRRFAGRALRSVRRSP